jgi:hypothetical protein
MTDLHTHRTADTHGRTPDWEMVGMQLLHSDNGKTYIIIGFCWLGETDEWAYLHYEIRPDGLPGVALARPIAHVHGLRDNGQLRYRIKT